MNGDQDQTTPADDIRDLVGAHALDALDELDRRRVEQLLETDADARAEAERLGRVVDLLAEAGAGDQRAPAGLLDGILRQLDDEPGSTSTAPSSPVAAPPTSAGGNAGPAGVGVAATASGPDGAGEVASLDRHRAARQGRRSKAPWLLSAAAAVVLVVAGGVALSSRDDGSSDPNRALEEIAAQVASQPGTRHAQLVSADDAVAAEVVVDAEGHAYVTVTGMDPAPAGHTYQMWGVDGGTPVSLGLLGDEPTVAVVGIDSAITELAVTIEPTGGSADPTTTPMASGTLQA